MQLLKTVVFALDVSCQEVSIAVGSDSPEINKKAVNRNEHNFNPKLTCFGTPCVNSKLFLTEQLKTKVPVNVSLVDNFQYLFKVAPKEIIFDDSDLSLVEESPNDSSSQEVTCTNNIDF